MEINFTWKRTTGTNRYFEISAEIIKGMARNWRNEGNFWSFCSITGTKQQITVQKLRLLQTHIAGYRGLELHKTFANMWFQDNCHQLSSYGQWTDQSEIDIYRIHGYESLFSACKAIFWYNLKKKILEDFMDHCYKADDIGTNSAYFLVILCNMQAILMAAMGKGQLRRERIQGKDNWYKSRYNVRTTETKADTVAIKRSLMFNISRKTGSVGQQIHKMT